MDRGRALLVATLGVFLTTSAAAQNTDDEIAALVRGWLGIEAVDFPQTVRDWGETCLTPLFVGLSDGSKRVIVDAGGIETGLMELETVDPEAMAAFTPALATCVETMLVGEQIWAWVELEGQRETPESRTEVSFCLMEAVRPLSTGAKQIIFLGADFEGGAENLIEAEPGLAGDLDARLEACY